MARARRTPNGTALSTFDSTLSSWEGQDGPGPFGGWVTGASAEIDSGQVFSFALSAPASWITGYGFLGCRSGPTPTSYP